MAFEEFRKVKKGRSFQRKTIYFTAEQIKELKKYKGGASLIIRSILQREIDEARESNERTAQKAT